MRGDIVQEKKKNKKKTFIKYFMYYLKYHELKRMDQSKTNKIIICS